MLAQTAPDFRVLVSDDSSEPDAARDVEAFVRSLNDPRVSYRYHSENLKEYGHGRFLFGQCSEKYFAILHDDDFWRPSFLERALEILEKDESLAFITIKQFIIDAEGNEKPDVTAQYDRTMGRDRYAQGKVEILEPLLTHSFFTLSSTVFRSDAVRRASLVDADLNGNGIFDMNMFMRLGERNEHAYYLAEPLAAYRIHDVRLTVSEYGAGFNARMLETFISLLDRRRFSGKAEVQRRRHLASAYHNYAVVCYFRKQYGGMYRYLAKCISLNPRSWENWAFGAFGVFCPFLFTPVFRDKVKL
jgi:hypothetical protein